MPNTTTHPSLADTTVVVTGAASGIGAATAGLLWLNGAHVILLDIREPTLPGGFHECDLSDPASIARAAEAIEGPIHALCNVAGIPGIGDPDRVLAVNLLGLRALTEALLPKLAPGGAIVNVASTAGAGWRLRYAEIRDLLATPDFAAGLEWSHAHPRTAADAYDFSKEAVIVYTKLLAATTARARSVRANSVSPGAVETPILRDFYASMDNELLDLIKNHAGRNAEPADVAEAVAFLASSASNWVNGLDLTIDGGGEAAFDVGVLRHPLHPTWGENR